MSASLPVVMEEKFWALRLCSLIRGSQRASKHKRQDTFFAVSQSIDGIIDISVQVSFADGYPCRFLKRDPIRLACMELILDKSILCSLQVRNSCRLGEAGAGASRRNTIAEGTSARLLPGQSALQKGPRPGAALCLRRLPTAAHPAEDGC